PGAVLQPAAHRQTGAAHAPRDAGAGKGAGRAEAGALHVRRRRASRRELRRAPGAQRRRRGAGDERTPDVGRNAAASAGAPGDQRHTGSAPPLTSRRAARSSRSARRATARGPPCRGTRGPSTAGASHACPPVAGRGSRSSPPPTPPYNSRTPVPSTLRSETDTLPQGAPPSPATVT